LWRSDMNENMSEVIRTLLDEMHPQRQRSTG
jgi:hypothetical protein